MSDQKNELWKGLAPGAQVALITRDYRANTFSSQVGESGIDAGRLASADRARRDVTATWIAGVEIFARTVHSQRHRGAFAEFVRRDEGLLSEIRLWPQQWAAARMFAQTAKGFHVHPPSIPKDTQPAEWFRRLFIEEPKNYALRRYEEEQWDVMFFVQGVAEMILRDVRAGLPKRTMRFLIDGDNHRGANNVAVVIPPGVAHAIRAEGSEDVIMVYGTSTSFRPEFEGRIASDVETATLPESWRKFLGSNQ